MNIIHQPCFNVDTMEGAVMHMLAVCDTLPAPAINAFVQKLAILRNRKVPEDYGMNSIIRQLKMKGYVYETGSRVFSLDPNANTNQRGIDAFWIFMEHMQGVDLQDVYKPSGFGNIAYTKNDFNYTIVRCRGDGVAELKVVCQKEMIFSQQKRKNPELINRDKYFFVFRSMEQAMNVPLLPNPNSSLFCTVKYDKQWVPEIRFLRTDVLQKRLQNGGTKE